jgi:hypothetical protein
MAEHTSDEHERLIELYGVCTTCAVGHARQQLARQDAGVHSGKADDAWKKRARRTILEVSADCDPRSGFTTDDVWNVLPRVNEPRVLGTIMRELAEGGFIVRTDTTRASTRPENHGRPVRVWQPAAGRLTL